MKKKLCITILSFAFALCSLLSIVILGANAAAGDAVSYTAYFSGGLPSDR